MQVEGAHHTRTLARRLSSSLRGPLLLSPRIHKPYEYPTSIQITKDHEFHLLTRRVFYKV